MVNPTKNGRLSFPIDFGQKLHPRGSGGEIVKQGVEEGFKTWVDNSDMPAWEIAVIVIVAILVVGGLYMIYKHCYRKHRSQEK